ncbi:hypothetical protein GF351_05220 [Candidatus Woesearchaeota archaeon]|nr:hypothetical protein [Candidatus Woesearchaeota archaeon]
MRKVSKDKYFIAAILTVGIFVLGLFMGFVIEGERVGYLQTEATIDRLDYTSMQLQYAYIDQLEQEGSCSAVQETFEENIKNIAEARQRLENFDEDATINKEEFKILQREYTIAQLRYWLLAKRTRDICDSEMTTILYFFATDQLCPKCEEQAFILDYLKKRFQEKLLIFALDSQLSEEPMIQIIKNTHEITTYPTLIIENEAFHGFTEQEDILRKICPYYESEMEDCIGYIPEPEVKNETAKMQASPENHSLVDVVAG